MSVAQLTEFTYCDCADYVDLMPRQTSLTGLLRSGAGPVQNPGGGARADPVQADGPGVAAEARAGNLEHYQIGRRPPCQVCRVWRLAVIRLRWLRLVSWERKLHLRSYLQGDHIN